MPLIGVGSGGDSSSGDDDSGDSVEQATLDSLGISWVTKLQIISQKPEAWIVGTLTAFSIEEAYKKLNDGQSAIELIVEEYLYQQMLLPGAEAVWDAGVAIIGAVLSLFLGTDHELGVSPGSEAGIADIPNAVLQPVITSMGIASGEVVTAITQFNQAIASQLAFMGLAGPAIVTAFWLMEAGLVIWVFWIAINIVDPGIVVATAKALIRPVRNGLEWIYD